MLDCHLISIFGYSSSRKLNNICRDLTDKHLSGAHHCSLQQVRSALHSSERGWFALPFISRLEGTSGWRDVVGCHLSGAGILQVIGADWWEPQRWKAHSALQLRCSLINLTLRDRRVRAYRSQHSRNEAIVFNIFFL